MKAIVIYGSVFGNTEKIAQAVNQGLGRTMEVKLLEASQMDPEELAGLDLLVVGSPTQKFRPIPPIPAMLSNFPKNGLKGINVAAFDTRLPESQIKANGVLNFFVNIFGYAARPIADQLVKKGGELVAPPEGFIVTGTEGPLLDGELERAENWAEHLAASIRN